MDPYTFKVFPDPDKKGGTEAPLVVMFLHCGNAISIKTVLLAVVNPEFASKNTSSVGVGGVLYFVVPPEVVLQCEL